MLIPIKKNHYKFHRKPLQNDCLNVITVPMFIVFVSVHTSECYNYTNEKERSSKTINKLTNQQQIIHSCILHKT